jgi:YidC/Oxa1 family membrane protein insertase
MKDGMDFQRTILWIIFGMSLLFLYDNWQRHQGRPSMFGVPPAPTAATKPGESVPTVPAAPGAQDGAVPKAAAPSATASPAAPPAGAAPPLSAPAQRLRIETDRMAPCSRASSYSNRTWHRTGPPRA